MADSSMHEMWIVEEVTPGVTPTSPVWVPMRVIGTTLGLGKQIIEVDELRQDRQRTGVRHGRSSVAGTITTLPSYSSHDNLLEASLCGTWVADTPALGTDQLMVGTTRRSFSILRRFSDMTGNSYLLYTGVEFDGVSMSVSPDGRIEDTYTCIGLGMSGPSSTPPAGSDFTTAKTTTEVFESFSATILEGGVVLGVATELSPSLSNNMAERPVIGGSLRPSIGRSNATGTIGIYFETSTLYEKFVNETTSSLDLTLSDLAGNALRYVVPTYKFTGGSPDVSGDGAVTLSMPYQAFFDSVTGTNFYIERTPV